MSVPEIISTCWTTAGNAVPLPGQDKSPIALRDRITAAAAAGFTGFGLMHVDLAAFLEQGDLKTLHSMFADNGITVVELEFLTGWWADGAARAESDQVLDLLLRASEVLRPHHVKVGPDITGGDYDEGRWAAEFARVSAAFAAAETPVALEFMPFSNVSTLSKAVSLVKHAGHENGGLMLDLWHLYRGAGTLAEVAALPLELVKGVELDDGDARQVGDGYTDTIHRRKLCGEGVFPVEDFIRTVAGLGWTGPWGLEILSESYRMRPLNESLPEAYRTTAAAFAKAGVAS